MSGEGAPAVVLPLLLLAALSAPGSSPPSSGAIADALGLESFLVPSPAEIGDALWENRSLLGKTPG